MGEASFIPSSHGLVLYAGDGAELRLTVTNPDGSPITLDGAVTAVIKPRDRDAAVAATFAVATAGNQATLTLTGAQTQLLGEFTGTWDCQWEPAGREPKTILQGQVTCRQDVTRG